MKKEYIWIYIQERQKLQRVDKNDPLFDWEYAYAPKGRVKRYGTKARSDANWHYRAWGYSKQECLDNVNQCDLSKISELEGQIERIRSRLVTLQSLGEEA